MNPVWETVAGSATATVVTLAAIGVAVFVGRTWISERIRRSIAHGYDLDLESYRQGLESERELFLEEFKQLNEQIQAVQATANAALIEGQRVSAEWRIKAADTLWREVLGLRNNPPSAVAIMDILYPAEYQRFVTHEPFRSLVEPAETYVKTLRLDSDIEWVRPFLGDEIFTLFFTYRATVGRICFLLEQGVSKGSVKPWFDDGGINRLLSVVLDTEEMENLSELTIGRLAGTRDLIEGKILTILRKVISGEVSTTEGLEQARKVQEIVQGFESERQRSTTP